jgi:hypothetical protein
LLDEMGSFLVEELDSRLEYRPLPQYTKRKSCIGWHHRYGACSKNEALFPFEEAGSKTDMNFDRDAD